MTLSIIAAVAKNGVIGNKGTMPWPPISADRRHFVSLTKGCIVVVGRTTYESLDVKPLPRRLNIVFTRSCNNSRESGALTGRKWQHADFPGCYTVGSFEEIRILPLNAWEGKPIFVIGGAELYALALAIADVGSMLYLTRVELEPEGDVFFPAFDLEQWQLIASEARCDEDTNQIGIRFETYERRTK